MARGRVADDRSSSHAHGSLALLENVPDPRRHPGGGAGRHGRVLSLITERAGAEPAALTR
ncbi:hypothetical protein ACIP39_05165 [Streptomyces tibetensis]|uniref:hypothetical protein n=1 Tax=Streptomyces tibetensis TaxID=2382123 RepID=UPI00380A9D5D